MSSSAIALKLKVTWPKQVYRPREGASLCTWTACALDFQLRNDKVSPFRARAGHGVHRLCMPPVLELVNEHQHTVRT